MLVLLYFDRERVIKWCNIRRFFINIGIYIEIDIFLIFYIYFWTFLILMILLNVFFFRVEIILFERVKV